MTILECPHCFTRVAISNSSNCPACGHDVHKPGDRSSNLTKMQIREDLILPAYCHLCDTPTDRKVRIRRKSGNGFRSSLLVEMCKYFVFIVFPKGYVYSESEHAVQRMKILIPACAACGSRKKVEPTYVDFPRGEFTFIVHRNFRDRVLQLNHRAEKS